MWRAVNVLLPAACRKTPPQEAAAYILQAEIARFRRQSALYGRIPQLTTAAAYM